ncbi:MAG: RNase H1/viroplasmin domain-containing protein, partial [Bacteroidales bacterium]|nr:RNase H1/viroplasmin domain-containing protein [Bacteroidales bacterium]
MSKKSKKFYVVWQGHQPGVYQEWADCLKQITGYSAPVFRTFSRKELAQKAFLDNPEKY